MNRTAGGGTPPAAAVKRKPLERRIGKLEQRMEKLHGNKPPLKTRLPAARQLRWSAGSTPGTCCLRQGRRRTGTARSGMAGPARTGHWRPTINRPVVPSRSSVIFGEPLRTALEPNHAPRPPEALLKRFFFARVPGIDRWTPNAIPIVRSLFGGRPAKNPVARCVSASRLEWQWRSTFVGQRGSGKSTGLRRLKAYLEQDGHIVFLCDMRDYLNRRRQWKSTIFHGGHGGT